MPSTTPTSPKNFLSDETNARNRLLDDIRIGATLKKSMTTEKSLVKSHGRVVSVLRRPLSANIVDTKIDLVLVKVMDFMISSNNLVDKVEYVKSKYRAYQSKIVR
jgi:hypothetical protein